MEKVSKNIDCFWNTLYFSSDWQCYCCVLAEKQLLPHHMSSRVLTRNSIRTNNFQQFQLLSPQFRIWSFKYRRSIWCQIKLLSFYALPSPVNSQIKDSSVKLMSWRLPPSSVINMVMLKLFLSWRLCWRHAQSCQVGIPRRYLFLNRPEASSCYQHPWGREPHVALGNPSEAAVRLAIVSSMSVACHAETTPYW